MDLWDSGHHADVPERTVEVVHELEYEVVVFLPRMENKLLQCLREFHGDTSTGQYNDSAPKSPASELNPI